MDKEQRYTKLLITEIFNALGKDLYENTYKFFLNVATSNKYDFKIIKPRRAFVLFEIFVEIFRFDYWYAYKEDFLDGYSVELSKVYNDSYIELIPKSNDPNNQKVLIIDDILIHGRSLSELLKIILKLKYKINNINCGVIFKAISAERVSNELHQIICKNQNIQECENEVWKKTSNYFVKTIQQSGYCYSCFAPQYEASNKDFLQNLKKYSPNKTEIQKESNLESIFYYDADKYNDYSVFSFIRYYNFNISLEQKDLFVPFIIIPSVKEGLLKKIFERFIDILFKNELINDDDKQVLIENTMGNFKSEFVYKLITFILSDIFMFKLTKDAKPTNDYFLFSSFGHEIEKVIKSFRKALESKSNNQIFYNVIELFNNENIKSSINNFKRESDSASIFKNINKNGMYDFIVSKYIEDFHVQNEKNAKNELDKLTGVDIPFMLSCFDNMDNSSKNQFIIELIKKWDSGESSYIIKKISGYICGTIVDGEQAYHISLQNCNNELNCFYEIYRRLNKDINSAIYYYELLLKYSKENGILNYNNMNAVLNYVKENRTIKEVDLIYPEIPFSNDIIKCLYEFRRIRRMEKIK